jgi:hypothetical protein
MPLAVKDHLELQVSVVRAALATGAAAVAAIFLPAPLAVALIALAATAAVVPPESWAGAAVALLLAIAAGAGVKLGGWWGYALAALAVGASLARGVVGPARVALAAACGTAGALTVGLVARALDTTGALDALPSGIATLVSGATAGVILGVSSLGRHLLPPRAAVDDELDALADGSELGQLLGRAATAYRDALQAMGDEAPAARAAADELVRKMARVGRRWRELEAEAARTRPEDVLARVELERTREALTAQLAALDEIRGGRERASARLEHQVATLERLRLAALRQRSADAGRLGAELQPVVDELTQAGGDFDIAAEALGEATIVAALPARSSS